jgi:hypothetical protein
MKRLIALVGAGLASFAISAFATPGSNSSSGSNIPNPTVTGPIATTQIPGSATKDYVFFASDHPLAVNGYIEQEFFIEGTANRYNTPTGATGSIIDGGHAYKTRVVVRRPVSKHKFNGTVLVEWSNVTNGFDAENLWFFGWEHVLRAGYAWVGVSAQRVGVDRLKARSPERYGTLDVTAGGTITNDALAYDIFMQAGKALRNPSGVNPLGDLKPKAFIAGGESQSAQRLSVFINSIMPLGNVYNGVFLLSNFGQAIRTDTAVPIFKVLFEWDVQTGEAAVRQDDTSKFRAWEVAGTAHVDHHLRLSREPLELRDLAAVSSEANLAPNCAVPTIGSRVPNHYVVGAALDQMERWVRQGKQPAKAPRFEIASMGPGNAAKIARNEFNLALGGIRLAEIAVPTAENVGESVSGGACPRWGYHKPFDVETLEQLYPNRGRYLEKVTRVTFDNVRHGYLLPEDAARTLATANANSVGK